MRQSWVFLYLLLVVGSSLVAGPAEAAEDRVEFFGDLRLRLESDFDSQRPDGVERADRDRLRLRGRLGLKAALTPELSLKVRLRTGSRESQQSSHLTLYDFDDNPRGSVGAVVDQASLRFEREGGWAWLGRDGFPFWKQNELFWDDDVTPVGAAGGHRFTVGEGAVELIGGYFTLPDGGVDLHGRLAAGQAVVSRSWGQLDLTSALGLFAFDGEPGARQLRTGNGARDYQIWVANLQAKRATGAGTFTLGLDLLHNAESYDDASADPFAAALRDQTDGLVASVQWGQVGPEQRWLFAYTFARIEALAVHASYAQDDWHRWGSATQTDSSDFRGHELRAVYTLTAGRNLVLRYFKAEALTSVQDGQRVRLDFNLRF